MRKSIAIAVLFSIGGGRVLNRMKPCYNSKCKYNSDCVCSLRKKSCAWRVKQERSFNDYVSLARSSDDVKLRDRNPRRH